MGEVTVQKLAVMRLWGWLQSSELLYDAMGEVRVQ